MYVPLIDRMAGDGKRRAMCPRPLAVLLLVSTVVTATRGAPAEDDLAGGDAAHVLAEKLDLPTRRMGGHEEKAQQRRLTCARRAGEEVERARPQVKVHVGQDLRAPIVLETDVRQSNHRRLAPGQR